MPARKLKSTFDWSLAARLENTPSLASLLTRAELLRSHEELRAALAIAEQEIRRLQPRPTDRRVLRRLQRVLKESESAAAVARSAQQLGRSQSAEND